MGIGEGRHGRGGIGDGKEGRIGIRGKGGQVRREEVKDIWVSENERGKK